LSRIVSRIVIITSLLVFFPARADIRNLTFTIAGGCVPGITVAGGISVAFCTGLVGIKGVVVSERRPLPTELMGVAVRVHGLPAPIFAVADLGGYQQINFQVPVELEGGPPTVEVRQYGQVARVQTDFAAFLADFFQDSRGYGVLQHGRDYSLVSRENPAERGEILIAYATGLGPVDPAVPSGFPAPPEPLSRLRSLFGERGPILKIDGVPTEVFFAGLTPALVGVYQIHFRVPETASAGDAEVPQCGEQERQGSNSLILGGLRGAS
jgi:uncharacterized protein (TIGR03437 family)